MNNDNNTSIDTDNEARKAEIMAMAVRDEPCPGPDGVTRRLGATLATLTSPKSPSYDPKFDQEIRAAAPNWTMKTAAMKKAEIVEVARRDEPRPRPDSTIGRSLAVYTNPNGTAYDPVFTQQVRELRPNWFS
jgi:hypothetical protein